MKKIISLSVFLLAFLICTGCTDKPKPQLTEEIKSGLRQDARGFMESLKSVLVKETQTNGIVAAVSVCSDTAQVLTNNYGVNKGIYIKRVSFKNRNPNNKPDEFESKALKYFEDFKSSGKLTETTEYFEVVEEEGVQNVRFIKQLEVDMALKWGRQRNPVPPAIDAELAQVVRTP